MSAAKKAEHNASPANAYEQTKQIIEQAGQNGMVAPLMNQLKRLLQDPVLRKTMEGMPASNSHPEKLN